MNNQNKQTKKYYQRAWFWMLMVIIISFVGAITYNVALGGKAGIQHHRIIVRYHRRVHQTDKVAGQKAHFKIDSLETVRAKLKHKLGTNNLKDVDPDKLNSTLQQLYGKEQINLINQGLLISVDMTPSQQNDMSTQIAREVNNPNLIVGVPKNEYTSDILTGKYTVQRSSIHLMADNPIVVWQSQDKAAWQKIQGHAVSSPQITNLPNNWIRYHIPNGTKGNHTMTGIVWIKAKDGDRMKDIQKVALNLKFKNANNNTTAELLNTNQKEQKVYKEFTLLHNLRSFNSNYLDKKVLGNSYIPVVFSMKKFIPSSDKTVTTTLNGQTYTLHLYTDKNGVPQSNLQIPND